jgi:tetratricopeptide (TPR) repeat protein
MEKFDSHQECIQRIVLTRDMYHDGTIAYSKEMYNLTGRLAEAHILAGSIDMARAILEKTESEALEHFGEDSFERGKALMALAGCSERQDKAEEAIALLQKAIAVKGYGAPEGKEEKAKAANGYFNLGLVLFNLNRFAEAVPHFEKAVLFRVQGGVPGDHSDMTEAKTFLANARKAQTEQAASS